MSVLVLTTATANYVELIEDGGEESAPPAPAHVEPEAEQEAAPEPVASAEGASATALYDYAADEEGELSQSRFLVFAIHSDCFRLSFQRGRSHLGYRIL